MSNVVLPEKLREDINSLLEIANVNGSLRSVTIMHWLNEKHMPELYTDVVEYFQEHFVTVIEDDIASLNDTRIILDSNKILIQQKPLSLEGIVKRIKYSNINLDTDFQRKRSLWDDKTKSQFIESLMLRIPIPPFYFDGTDDDNWLVIDGLQRLSAIKEFVIDKSLKLTELEYFTDYNGCGYDALPYSYVRRIDETQFSLYLLMPGTPNNIKYNIFKRINTPGLKLENQEIRHALYQGKSTRLLENLSETEEFIKATDGSIPKDRMLDREIILRYIGFKYLGVDRYTYIDDFLNQTMEYLNKRTEDEIQEIKDVFLASMECAYGIFGVYAFRRISEKNPRKKNPINVALFESWTVELSKLSRKQQDLLVSKKDQVINKFMDVLKDHTYSSDLNTAKYKSIKRRFEVVNSIINEVLDIC
jgi:hypothetical protein